MNKSKKIVQAEKTVYTFAYLRNISWTCLRKAKDGSRGSYNLIASSMVFTVFSIEAYLNHLGSNVTNFWETVERKLSPKDKLDTLSSILNIDIDYGSRPFQTFLRMITFRNALAHGKTEELTENSIQILSEDDIPELPNTSWEEEISINNASRYLDDAKEMISILNKEAGIEDYLLWTPGESGWTIADVDTEEDT